MTTPKALIVAGTKVEVTNRKNKVRNALVLASPAGSHLDGYIIPPDGTVLTILSKPKKVQGINFVEVGLNKTPYVVFYENIRYDTTPVVNIMTAVTSEVNG